MCAQKSRNFEEQELLEIRQALQKIVKDIGYNTTSTYSANSETYPDHLIPFVEKHIDYLKKHPGLNPKQYIANLRLMTKKR